MVRAPAPEPDEKNSFRLLHLLQVISKVRHLARSISNLAMRFSRKLQKLLSPELFASASEHLSRWTHPVNKRRILDDIDWLQFRDLRHKFPYRPGSPQINRFEDVVYWIEINVERAQDLWLDRAPPLRILDLGSGAGYFLYVCKSFGHHVLGFDTDKEPLFRATIEL